MKRKLIKNLLLVLTLVVLCFAVCVTASAKTWGDYEYDVLIDGTIEITGYNGSDAELEIPAEIDGKVVTVIGFEAFMSCDSLTSVIIPNGVKMIDHYAFMFCHNLTSITIPDSVTNIGDRVFIDTEYYDNSSNWENDVLYIGKHLIEAKDSISDVYEIKNGTLTIAGHAFWCCDSLTSVTIPDSVITIGDSAFLSCDNLTNVTIPDSVTTIDHLAFGECISLKNITIPDSVTTIGYRAFSGTGYYNDPSNWENDVLYIGKHLTNVSPSISGDYTIKNGTLTIGGEAFALCEDLTGVTIPNSVTTIGYGAFCLCSNLTSVIIPNSVTTIGYGAFMYCYSLTSITIPDSVITIDYAAFYECTNLTSITIPNSVTTIGDGAFAYCSSLESATIPDSVTAIGDMAFAYCTSLTSITIPDSITAIGYGTFGICSNLTSITIPDSVMMIGDMAFYECPSLTDVYYMGNEEQWKAVEIGSENDYLLNATIHFHTHFFEGEWTYDYDNLVRYRKCIHCDELETEAIESEVPTEPETPAEPEPEEPVEPEVIPNSKANFYVKLFELIKVLLEFFGSLFGE